MKASWAAIRRAPFSFVVVAVCGWAIGHDIERRHLWRDLNVLHWDIETYHHYLPATIIHGDPRDLSYVASIDSVLHPGSSGRGYGVEASPIPGRHYLKYSYGTALFQLPLFLVAHAWALSPWSWDPPNGYSMPYQLAVQVSTGLAVVIGLLVLRRFLLRHTTDRAAAVALIVLGVGNNLFYYSTVATGMSHPYLFLLTALLLDLTDRWHRSPTPRLAASMGLVCGLAIVTRPNEALLAVVPLAWWCWPARSRMEKLNLLRDHPRHLVLAAAAALLTFIPQLAYWKAATGSWIVYSYRYEGFDFSDPHILEGLFGFRKGWFVYSPLVFLGFLGLGMMFRDRSTRTMAVPVLAYFIPAIYVTFSWTQWWYGGSFGCRALLGSLPLLGLPLAYLTERAFAAHKAVTTLLLAIVILGVRLNYFQTEQYMATIIHWDSMTWDRYWEVFGVDRWDNLPPFPR